MRYGIDARLLAYQGGGIPTYIRRLSQALCEMALGRDEGVTVFQSRRSRERVVSSHRCQVRSLWTPPHHILEEWGLGIELALAPLDLIHSPDFIPPFRRRCPAVITVHDLDFLRSPETKTAGSLRYYGQIGRAVDDAEGIISVSETTARDLTGLLGVDRARVHVVHHGVGEAFRPLDDEGALDEFCRSRGLPRQFVLWVGTIEPRKNLPCLFQAMSGVIDRLPESKAHLVLVGPRGWGTGPIDAAFERSGLAGRTTFFGPASEEELVLLYNAAWVFAFPSNYEGFGLPPLEAMGCGTPVVASSAPALPEVLSDAALFFDPHDPEELGAALMRVSEDGELASRLAASGVKRAAQFRWADTARRTLDVYRTVAGR
ncbi:MAG: glycosyltransferase family 1 protein [Dehalococcoidia bacterium]|nr:glycosyltransferase family 1 protein [Dehalococcoidia bacterium]